MKILHVTHGYFPESSGGIEAYLAMTTKAQQAAGDEVEILSGSMELAETCGIESAEVDGVRVHRLRRNDWYFDHYARSFHPEVSRLIRELFAELRPDVMHLHQWIRLSSDLVAIARELGIKTVVTLHDVYSSCPRAFRMHRDGSPCARELSTASCASCVPKFGHETERELQLGIELFRDQYRAELAMADRVLVAMNVTADLLSRTTGTPRETYHVHDLPYARRFAGRDSAGSSVATGGAFRFGYWGSLAPHKGTSVLIEAFRSAHSRLAMSSEAESSEPESSEPESSEAESAKAQPIELHLLGPIATSALGDELRRLAEGLPVTFHGAFDAAQLAAANLHCGLFPAVCFEAFGLGLAECFELGLPAIVSDIGALGERIGAAGVKVPPGDSHALSDAMVKMCTSSETREVFVAAIPDLPPSPVEHVAALRVVYDEVSAAARLPEVQLSAERRAEFLLLQRESLAAENRDLRGRKDPD